jgi:hypothetical protein
MMSYQRIQAHKVWGILTKKIFGFFIL